MRFQAGDRVRVTQADSAYTGCRGTIGEDPAAGEPEVTPLGYFVAIDGENGRTRPFRTQDLERLAPLRVRARESDRQRQNGV